MNPRPGPAGHVRAVAACLLVGFVAHARLTSLTAPAGVAAAAPQPPHSVRVWEETVEIPTYVLGPPDPNPIFYEGESYQGAQRHVYPYALQDAVTDRRESRSYRALMLENEYLRISVLPELGGRIFSAVDKTNGYDFFYRQHVIKPALIGMLGAWISGGVEWDAFHHHRATTFMPVDYALSSNRDGSKTIWVGEMERRQRMRWMVGLTLRPGRSVLDVTVRLINRTPMPQTMLYWTNAAVHVNDRYQIIFPPSVRLATFHGKSDFTTWPIGSGIYRGVDYSGVDLSWWRNHPNPTSFFAWDLVEDFFGGYDHGRQAGVVHVGDHHVMPGAKLWEWGPGDAGRLWDTRILTDTDGPYAELMAGAYSDNQPDYSWLDARDTRMFTDHWYPVRDIGGFKNANVDAAANLEIADGVATVGFHTTSARRRARAVVMAGGRAVLDERADIDPGHPFLRRVRLPPDIAASDVEVQLLDAGGASLIRYRPAPVSAPPPFPEPVRPPPQPAEVRTSDELLAIGEWAEQINSPTVDPDAYFWEALRRDSADARGNLRLGIRLNRRGLYADAERHLRRALERLGPRYLRPEETEALYQLGIALRGQGRSGAARDAFQRAAWGRGQQAASYHELAELSLGEGALERALIEIRRALAVDAGSEKARGLEAAALRRLGHPAEAETRALAAAADDPLGFLALNEIVLARRARRAAAAARSALAELSSRMRGEVESYLELAADYESAGLWSEAVDVLERAADLTGPSGEPYPMVHYHLAYDLEQLGRNDEAAHAAARAAALPPEYCFPFRLESVDVLRAALRRNPRDSRALYYLGNLLYEMQPQAAIRSWEAARQLEPGFAAVNRNLGWAYRWRENDLGKAAMSYEAARAVNGHDPRLAIELDEIYDLANAPLETRLAALRRDPAALPGRPGGLAREVLVLNGLGRYDEALASLEGNHFHVEELSGAIHDAFVDAHLLRGLRRLAERDVAGAADDFTAAGGYPDNLSVGRPPNDPRAPQVAFFLALAREAAGDTAAALRLLEQAAAQRGTDGWPETRFYQALALERLGRTSEAGAVFDLVVRAGEVAVARATEPGSSSRPGAAAGEAAARRVHGLGLLGRGDRDEARRELARAAQLRPADPWARYHLATLEQSVH